MMLTNRQRSLSSRARFLLLGCLLLLLSGCTPFSASSPTPTSPVVTIVPHSVPTPMPTATSTPGIDVLAASIVEHMSLEEKLGQMVIVEFYGSTLDGNLQGMVQTNHVSGVLIENKNGNAKSAGQLTTLNHDMQAKARIPLFISTDYEGGLV